MTQSLQTSRQCNVQLYHGTSLNAELDRIQHALEARPLDSLNYDLRWLNVLRDGLGHAPYCLEVRDRDRTLGVLPLAFVQSRLFGKFLVSLPYLNSSGVIADDPAIGRLLIDRAVELADELQVRYLQLRHEQRIEHPALTRELTNKVHMRFPLPATVNELWNNFSSKLRNQVRKGQKNPFLIQWGKHEILPNFYSVFCRNMRDLGTPVYGEKLFRKILDEFSDQAEMCCLWHGRKPIAAALLLHGPTVTEVPSSSSLREYNSTNANMLMYWYLIERAVQRKQQSFDFGRSTIDSGTFTFKSNWGAMPAPAVWQYYLREGDVGDMRPESPRYQRLIRIWQRLPVPLTRWIGPPIVRGIP